MSDTQKQRYFPDTCSRQINMVNKSLSRALKAIREADAEIGAALRQDLRIWRELIYIPEHTSVKIVHN